MPRSLAVGRALARRRLPPPPRRHLQGSSDSVEEKIAKLSDTERAELSRHLDKMGEELQSKLVQEMEAYSQRPTFENDKGNVNRVLTFCRVPKGERREKLIWRSSLAVLFVGSWVVGHWQASRCIQNRLGYEKEQGEETANDAA